MKFERMHIPEVIRVVPKRFEDARGFFSEVYRQDAFVEGGVDCEFVQDNHSLSRERGVLRGLHFQTQPHAQDKLVRCVRGRVLDLAVDIRVGSPTFGQYVAVELSEENGHQLFVPVGFAHGFLTLEENCEVLYKVSSYYSPECDKGVLWNDPALGIDWPIPEEQIILSDKDKSHPELKDLPSFFTYQTGK